ncbi:PREDICTED: vacuolar cation/proton exchanger 1-like [Camelina sativa]|uniref:Vacuolar cation/proton exchanger n=1 Tax=Camelina sativa TaxID=90675 RepID=A0ABM1QYK4_CAMSA|nr:PREDICTED: vacuolar cation/proton exchanger 1-like [Camelina sativa]
MTSSSSSLRKKTDLRVIQKVPYKGLSNIQQVLLGTKLAILFLAIPAAIICTYCGVTQPWIFGLSLLGLTPLAERVSFLTEQVAFYIGPTLGGLLNATCGNATELIIAIMALTKNKVALVKYSLLGSILSNLLLVLGTSLFCGGFANFRKEQRFDRKQADVNFFLLLMGLLCHMLPLLFKYMATTETPTAVISDMSLNISLASSIIMLIAYIAYLVFKHSTHHQLVNAQDQEDEYDDNLEEETALISFWSGFAWLVGMTLVIVLLSGYVVATIEDASETWNLPVSFISIILLHIVGNAAEHAEAVIFAFKNKLDISFGIALGSAAHICLFVVPLTIIMAWILGINMDLNFGLLETGSLALSIIVTAFTLQDGTSHYMKGLVLLLCYFIIAICFFLDKLPQSDLTNVLLTKISQGRG